MGFARRSILVCLVGTACLATVAVGQTIEPGAIEGRVLDVHGNGVAGVRLGAYVDGPVAGRLPTAVSAGDGSFRIASVQPGTYRMGSAKEEDGYPDTMWGGIADSRTEVPTVEVFAGHTTSDVNIHLGPPTGVLHGTVLDDHGRPMMSARLVVYPEDEPDLTVSTSLREGANVCPRSPRPVLHLDD